MDKRSMRKSLYAELASNLSHFLPYSSNIGSPETHPYPTPEKWYRTYAFKAATAQPMLFSGIQESNTFFEISLHLETIFAAPTQHHPRLLHELERGIGRYINDGVLSRALLNRYYAKWRPSPFESAFKRWRKSTFHKMTTRNTPNPVHVRRIYPGENGIRYREVDWYDSAETLFGKIKALISGVPGKPMVATCVERPPNSAPQMPNHQPGLSCQ
jgi:hypothetical protein